MKYLKELKLLKAIENIILTLIFSGLNFNLPQMREEFLTSLAARYSPR